MSKGISSFVKSVANVVAKETGTATGNANLRGGFLIFLLLGGLLVPDIIFSVVNFFLGLISDLSMPALPRYIIVGFLLVLTIYFIVSFIVISKVEREAKFS